MATAVSPTAMAGSEAFLLAMLVIFAAPYLVWRVLRTDSFAPLVVVQIVAGVVLGPGVLGAVAPGWYGAVFNPGVIAMLSGLAQWAVMLFVWVAGLELDFGSAWARRGDTAVAAGFALVAPLALGAIASEVFLSGPAWRGPHGATWQVTLGIGMACAVTALPILVLLMEKLDLLRRPLGQRVLRYASLDDVAIWAVLALIIADWSRLERQGVFLAGFAAAAWGVRALMKRLPHRDRWYVALVWLALCGFAADWSGLHFMVGAFLSGLVLERSWFGEEAVDRFRDTVLLTLMPVFFLSTGLRTRWDVGGAAVFGAATLLLTASVAGKLGGVALAARLLRWPPGQAAIIGWLLQTKALIMIIFCNILLDRGVISGATFTALLIMAVASTTLTIPVITFLRRKSTNSFKMDVAHASL